MKTAESPVLLGLPDNAETLLLISQGNRMLRKVLQMQSLDEGEIATDSQQAEGSLASTIFF